MRKSQKFALVSKLAKPVFVVGVTTEDRVLTTEKLAPAIVSFKEYDVVKGQPDHGTEFRANIVVFDEKQRIIKHESNVQALIDAGVCQIRKVERDGKEFEVVVQAAHELRLVAESDTVQGYEVK